MPSTHSYAGYYRVPPILQIESTNRCNLSCHYCLREAFDSEGERGDLTPERFKRVLDQGRFKYVTLHGWGEPLLNTSLFEMIQHAKSKRIAVNFNTNGTLLKERSDDILDSGLDTLALSLSSGVRINRTVLDNAAFFIRQKQSLGREKPQFFYNVALMPENYADIAQLLLMAHNTSVDAVNFERIFPTDRGISPSEEARLFSLVKRTAHNLKVKVYLPPRHCTPCRLFKRVLFVRWNGAVTPCCYLANVSVGNIESESLSTILDRRKAFRKAMHSHPVCCCCTA